MEGYGSEPCQNCRSHSKVYLFKYGVRDYLFLFVLTREVYWQISRSIFLVNYQILIIIFIFQQRKDSQVK